jgi:antitoxin (DNA-binding transcriptional repressor) of toxin-antitoxin stability system
VKRSIKKLSLAKANTTLAAAAESLNGAALVLTVKGKPVAALVPVQGMDWESLVVSTSPDFIDLIERSRRNYKEYGGHSSEEVRRELGLPPFNPEEANGNGEKPKTRATKRPGTGKTKTRK